jgi:signal transduction histidine kinase
MVKAASAAAGRHHVQFYEDAGVLADHVAAHLDDGLRAGGAGLAIARASTLELIEARLRERGHDVAELRARGQLVLLDAIEMLDDLLVDAMPDRNQFREHVARAAEQLAAAFGGAGVHAYGEMVDVLWARGGRRAVLALEALWSELLATAPISLVCGYRLGAFEHDPAGLELVCDQHVSIGLDEPGLEPATSRALAHLEQRARGTTELLYEVAAAANQLDDVDAFHDVALHTVRRGAHADRAAILLFDETGVMRFVASHGLSEAYRRAVDGHSPWQRNETSPAIIAIDDVDADPAWAAYREVFRAEGIRALAFVPLVHHRRLIGKFMLYRDEPRAFAAGELQLAATVAVHVAQAVVRKQDELELERAYREEREVRLLAQEATRAREEILSVVSHDLKNPLATILMSATSLLKVDPTERNHRARMIGERIHRQAQRMARLIEDLVDFAGIQAGQIVLDRKANRANDIVAATSEMFRLVAHERGLRFEACTPPDLPPVDCDSERAVQVMSNLLTNALKVTPRGGEIRIGAEPMGDDVVFYVRDTGPGIEADELPRLFERYWRSKQSHYKGAGLGLSIARGLVDAHGGRIWAESEPGSGTTFYFSLAGPVDN